MRRVAHFFIARTCDVCDSSHMEEIVTRINTRVPDEIQLPLTKAIYTLFGGNNSALVIKWIRDRLEQEGYLSNEITDLEKLVVEFRDLAEARGIEKARQLVNQVRDDDALKAS